MKSVFDQATREELIRRINSLNENSKREWGKMNVYQMLKHCTLFEEKVLGKTKYKRSFMGLIFGKMVLKGMLKDDEPLKRNMPTLPGFTITENGDVESQKKKWAALIGEYANFSNDDYVHPFFGKMTREQVGPFAFKHADHHLRQFNV